jgi:hexulose-6-phosphate isomerase
MMNQLSTRRDFLAATAAAGAGLLAAGRLEAAPFKTRLHKAMIGKPTDAKLAELKAAGFEGIEANTSLKPHELLMTPDEACDRRKAADKLGMRIHSMLRGWMNFNNPGKVDADIDDVARTLQIAHILGAETVLVVPCRIDVYTAEQTHKAGKPPKGVLMPEAWEFDIEFDEKTGHVHRVVSGDNTKYQPYIDAQNQATDMSRAAVKRLIPAAEKSGVIVALENVWNNLWVKPALAKNFIASFDNPWVRSYFDIGNHVKFAPPQDWIHTLGKLIVKCHVKDFQLNPDGHGGHFVHPRDGSINWPAVRQALDDVGYNGWLSIEDGGLPLDEFNRRFDLILAGK